MDTMALLADSIKSTQVSGGVATKRNWQFSIILPKLLDDLIRSRGNEWFANAEYDAIKIEVDKAFALIPEIKVELPPEPKKNPKFTVKPTP